MVALAHRLNWLVTRKRPYTPAGIVRQRCIRCGKPAMFQWQICSDGNNYRPLCGDCDVALNLLVLKWMKHPNAAALISNYKQNVIAND